MKNKNDLHSQLLGEVRTFGTPFHGLVRDGQITLPGNITRPYPQPSAARPEKAGVARLFQIPGLPEVETTPAEAALGLKWENSALLTGSNFQYAGRALAGWLYVDAVGDRWLIQPQWSQLFPFAEGLSLTFNISKFGAFGEEPLTFSRTVNQSNWGQQGYSNPTVPSDARSGVAVVDRADIELHATSPTGHRAALAVVVRRDSLPNSLVVLGWLEVTVSGDGEDIQLGLAVLKNRAETLIFDLSITGPGQTVASSHELAGGFILQLFNFNEERELRLECLAGAYWSSGWEFVRFGVEWQQNRQASMNFVQLVDGDTLAEYEQSEQNQIQGKAYFKVGPHEIKAEYAFQHSVSNWPLASGATFTTSPGVSSVLLYEEVEGVVVQTDTSRPPSFNTVGPNFFLLQPAVSGTDRSQTVATTSRAFSLDPANSGVSSPHAGIVVIPCRYSDLVWGFLFYRTDQTSIVRSFRSELVSPAGVSGTKEDGLLNGTRPSNDILQGNLPPFPSRLFTSWNPQTNQTAPLDTVPVCWV